MKKICLLVAIFGLNACLGDFDLANVLVFKSEPAPLSVDGKTLAEELGFDEDTKLLVVNSDDTAAHESFSKGVFKIKPAGLVKSTSVIVNDRNEKALQKVAYFSKLNPDWGVGIHLALTNEYQEAHPWSPVLSKDEVPSLYNDKGLAWEKISEVETKVDPKEAEREFEAQIKKALENGVQISHIDSHMGTYYRTSQYPNADPDGLRMAAVRVAEKYNLPMTVNTFDKEAKKSIGYIDGRGMIRPDTFFGFYELAELNTHLSYEGSVFNKWVTAGVVELIFGFELPYQNFETVDEDALVRMEIAKQAIINILKPGLNHFYMHAAVVDVDQHIDVPSGKNHEDGLDRIVRLSDFKIWSSQEMKDFLENQGVVLINYVQLQKIQEKRMSVKPLVNPSIQK